MNPFLDMPRKLFSVAIATSQSKWGMADTCTVYADVTKMVYSNEIFLVTQRARRTYIKVVHMTKKMKMTSRPDIGEYISI